MPNKNKKNNIYIFKYIFLKNQKTIANISVPGHRTKFEDISRREERVRIVGIWTVGH